MMFAGASFASTAFASQTPLSTATVDPWDAWPLTILHNNVHVQNHASPNTLTIDDTQGEQVSAAFTLVNPLAPPTVGDLLEVRYFGQVIFSGTIDKVRRGINQPLTVSEYQCTAVDWTQTLVRRKINRLMTDVPLSTLVASVLDNELSGEGFRFGSTDQYGMMELVDAQKVSVFDLFRDAAGVSGQVLFLEYDKTLRFLATSNPSAPFSLTYSTVETAALDEDREQYRNVQTVIAKGTPAEQNEAVITITVVQENTEQIAERQTIEGGSGRYEHIQEMTHPTSNVRTTLARLAETYATLLLATGGTPRTILTARVRGYGFRAGQAATVDLPVLSLAGTWLVQRVAIREEDGRRLVHDLELVESSLQRRVYESWANIIGGGQIVISIPGIGFSSSTDSYTTPGSHQWISPITGTITITTVGGSGGGCYLGHFGKGGSSGKTVSSLAVNTGDVIDITVGSKGNGGTVGSRPGVAGTPSAATRAGVEISWAGGGGGAPYTTPGLGTPGGGRNGVVTVGGGKIGGTWGTSSSPNGKAGQDGSVTIEY